MSILVKDKFLFTATSLPADVEGATLSNSQLTEVLKVNKNDSGFRRIVIRDAGKEGESERKIRMSTNNKRNK